MNTKKRRGNPGSHLTEVVRLDVYSYQNFQPNHAHKKLFHGPKPLILKSAEITTFDVTSKLWKMLICYKSGRFKDASINRKPGFSCTITFINASTWKSNILKFCRKHIHCFHVVIFGRGLKPPLIFLFFLAQNVL